MAAAGLSDLRLTARLARREAVRRPWRSLLVGLLVAIPVAGMVIAAVWVRTDHQTPIERWRLSYGYADLYATPGSPDGQAAEPTVALDELLPPGARVVSYRSEWGRVLRTVDEQRTSALVMDLPMGDPLVAPIMQLTSGRAPERAGEVMLTRAAADDLEADVGDTLRLERPEPLTWTVVGVGEKSEWWDSSTIVLAPGTRFPWRADAVGYATRTVLVDLPDDVTPAELSRLSRFADGVAFAPGIGDPTLPGTQWDTGAAGEDSTKVAWSWVIGAVVLTVVGIVIAAAFAAGARRQLATLGQLAANGASPTTLRRVLFLQGTWTGLFGTGLGVALAAAVLAVAEPHVDNLLNRNVDPYTARLSDLVPIVLLGVLAATVAALLPARTTARIPVMAALAGRRPLRPVPTWLTVTGVGVSTAGLALLGLAVLGSNEGSDSGNVWALTAVVGGVAILLGACAVAPGYVSILELLARRLTGASRLAARSLARQRTRTGAVVSAVCATSALAIGASALVLAADAKDAREPDSMRDDEIQIEAHVQGPVVDEQFGPVDQPAEVPDELVASIQEAIPGAEARRLAAVRVPGAPEWAWWEVRDLVPDQSSLDGDPAPSLMSGPFPQSAVVADDDFMALYDLPDDAREALAEDGAVAIGHGSATGTATVTIVAEDFQESPTGAGPPVEELITPFDVRVIDPQGLALGSLPRIVVTSARAQELGLEPTAGPVIVRAPQPLSESQRNEVQDILDEDRDTRLDTVSNGEAPMSVNFNILYPSDGPSPRLVEALLTLAALLLSLFVVTVSLALAAAETRDERDVLAVVGARPSTMRKASGRKALLLTFLGAALAVPVGFLPVSVFTAASQDDLPLVFPWRVALLLLVAVPVVSALVTTVFSGIALRLRPVRVSTMAFE